MVRAALVSVVLVACCFAAQAAVPDAALASLDDMATDGVVVVGLWLAALAAWVGLQAVRRAL